MRELQVGENEAGQRLDKLLGKYLSSAPKSFLYKMMRKKNITLNGKKASGSEITAPGDVVRLFFSEETLQKFSGSQRAEEAFGDALPAQAVIYEDAHVLIVNKPAGTLSQKGVPGDVSLNEQILAYLLQEGALTEKDLQTFRPSVCNRLDRNTSGLTLAGKSLAGLQALSEILRSRTLHKFYLCPVLGEIREGGRLTGALQKQERTNRVSVRAKEENEAEARETPEKAGEAFRAIVTEYRPLFTDGEITLLEVLLVTGRTHQIRAHLASTGHPILGDNKYGDRAANRALHLRSQLLHAYRMEFPEAQGALGGLSGRVVTAPVPEDFAGFLRARGCDLQALLSARGFSP